MNPVTELTKMYCPEHALKDHTKIVNILDKRCEGHQPWHLELDSQFQKLKSCNRLLPTWTQLDVSVENLPKLNELRIYKIFFNHREGFVTTLGSTPPSNANAYKEASGPEFNSVSSYPTISAESL